MDKNESIHSEAFSMLLFDQWSMTTLHLLVEFDQILIQINPEIQGDANLHPPPWYEATISPHDKVKSREKCKKNM